VDRNWRMRRRPERSPPSSSLRRQPQRRQRFSSLGYGSYLAVPLNRTILGGGTKDLADTRGVLARVIASNRLEVGNQHSEFDCRFGTSPALGSTWIICRLLMRGPTFAQPHNFSEELRQPVRSVPPRVIRSAVDFLEGAAEAVSPVADIARAANLSARALEHGFGSISVRRR
jgi:hypothetical protein